MTLAVGVLAPVAQAQGPNPGFPPLWEQTLFNEPTGTWYTSPDEGKGAVENRNPNYFYNPRVANPEIQFVADAFSPAPCQVTFELTNATNAPYLIIYRIDGERFPPYSGRDGVTNPGGGTPYSQLGKHTWGWKTGVEQASNTIDLRDLADLPNPDADSHTIAWSVAGPEDDYINPDVPATARGQWEFVPVTGCAEPPVECPVCTGSLGSIAEGSLGSLEGEDGSLSDSSGSETGPDGSLATVTGSLIGSAGSAAGSDENGSLEELTGSLSDSLGTGSDGSGSLEELTGSLSGSLGDGSVDAGSLTASLAPLGSAAGSLPLLIPVALIGGSIAAAPMIQQSLAGLNIPLPALPDFPPLAGSAMPGTPPIAAPAPAPGPPSPNGRG